MAARRTPVRGAVASAGPGAGRAVQRGGRAVGGAGGPGFEIAVGAPAEHRLGEQHLQTALEMAELFGGMTAVPALRQMFTDIGQKVSAPANRDIQETVVETAFTGGREFPVGADATGAELLARLLQGGGRTGRVHAQQTGRYGYGFGLDLGMPQQALGGPGKSPECAFGELPPFRGDGPRRA